MPHRRLVASLLLAAYLSACVSYQATNQPLAELTASPKPVGRVCITRRNGTRLEVRQPRVTADSLLGMNAASGTDAGRIAIALADIQSAEVKKFDTGKTVALIVILGGTFALMTAAATAMVDGMFDDMTLGY